jgi:hypothetical protein
MKDKDTDEIESDSPLSEKRAAYALSILNEIFSIRIVVRAVAPLRPAGLGGATALPHASSSSLQKNMKAVVLPLS